MQARSKARSKASSKKQLQKLAVKLAVSSSLARAVAPNRSSVAALLQELATLVVKLAERRAAAGDG